MAALLVPKRVAGGAVGKTLKRTGMEISPPPPAIALTNPATSEAMVRVANSSIVSQLVCCRSW
jgi:hypothetical protein